MEQRWYLLWTTSPMFHIFLHSDMLLIASIPTLLFVWDTSALSETNPPTYHTLVHFAEVLILADWILFWGSQARCMSGQVHTECAWPLGELWGSKSTVFWLVINCLCGRLISSRHYTKSSPEYKLYILWNVGPSATTGFIYSCALSNSAYKLGRSSQDSPRHCISYLTLSSSALLSSASRCSTFIIASCSSSVRKLRSIILLCVEGLAKCQEDLKSCWGE